MVHYTSHAPSDDFLVRNYPRGKSLILYEQQELRESHYSSKSSNPFQVSLAFKVHALEGMEDS
jgi:hypothetical protein